MLKPIMHLAGLLLLLGLLTMPATALAAPTITITPTAVPRGGEVTVTGSGFAPNAALTAVLEVDGGRRVPVADLTAAADGTIRLAFRIPTSAPVAPGGTTVALLILARADQTVLARGQLTVTDAPPVTAEQVTIAPPAGPAGTRFVATGTGFTAGASLRLVVAPTATGAQTPPERQVNLGTVQVGAEGRFSVTIDSRAIGPSNRPRRAHRRAGSAEHGQRGKRRPVRLRVVAPRRALDPGSGGPGWWPASRAARPWALPGPGQDA